MDIIESNLFLNTEKNYVQDWINSSYTNAPLIPEVQHIYRCRLFTEKDKEFFYPIVYRFCDKHQIEYKDKNIVRSVINENYYSKNSIFSEYMIHRAAYNPHVDYKEPNNTFIIYLIDSTIPTILWSRKQQKSDKGSMVPIEEGGTIIKKIYPKQFDIVWLDGDIYHSQELPTYNEKRIVAIIVLEK